MPGQIAGGASVNWAIDRSMSSHLRTRLPLSVALPLFVAIAMFVVAVGTTQLGMMALRSANETGLRDQALVFLDAVAGNVAVEVARADAPDAVRERLAASLNFRTALLEQAMAAEWTDSQGVKRTAVIADSDADLLEEGLAEVQNAPSGQVYDTAVPDRSLLLVARSYAMGEFNLYLAATFDMRPLEEAASVASNIAIGVDVLVAILAAILAYLVTRRALKPLDRFIDRLADEGADEIVEADWRRGDELRRLEAALSIREKFEAQRVAMMEKLAQQERDGLLARMAASIAHEVRNPLAGLKNGVSTLKRFGDREEVRRETLEFLENGLDSIGRVVDVTLSTYRRRSGERVIGAREVRDLELLVGPEAKRAAVKLVFELDERARLFVDADALRQILLNLILNAVRASSEGQQVTVGLAQSADHGHVVLTVADQGPGMPPELVAAIVSGRADDIPVERSIGIWMVANLVETIGADLSIRSAEGAGTTIQLTLKAKIDETDKG